VLCYCSCLTACALCYRGLGGAIARTHFAGHAELEAYSRASGRKNQFALMMNILSVIAAFWHPGLSMALIVAVALMYFVPGTWIESALNSSSPQ
jgi:uncharacterized membrane protein